MLRQAGQGFAKRIDIFSAESARGPCLQGPQIEFQANHGKARIQRWAHIHRTIENSHGAPPPPWSISLWPRRAGRPMPPACAS